MDKLLTDLYASLNLVIFRHTGEDQFQLYSTLPEWLVFFCGTAQAVTRHALLDYFPYLHCFMPDAEQHWQARHSWPLSSGPWLETDALGEELALEATALWLADQPVLLLQNLGEKYQQDVQRFQQMRNGLLTQEKLEHEIRQRTLKIKQRDEEIALKLVSLTSYRDAETGAHTRRIGLYAAAMAHALHWPDQQVDDIRIAAPMHDLGKIAIPDRVLLKAGKLTEAEFAIMQRHTEIGARMLEGSQIPLLDMAADIALCHHEKWDGSGYPRALCGTEIPLAARITTIVDIYDALVHERVYKRAISEREALEIMRNLSGSHLDPDLLQLFFNLLPVMRRIRSEVQEIDDLMVCDQPAANSIV